MNVDISHEIILNASDLDNGALVLITQDWLDKQNIIHLPTDMQFIEKVNDSGEINIKVYARLNINSLCIEVVAFNGKGKD